MRHFSELFAVSLVFIAVTTLNAQPSSEGPMVLRTDTRVVEIDVAVRDGKGKVVENLGKDDFVVSDNGKPRPFSIFSVIHSTPEAGPAEPLPPGTFTNLAQSSPSHSTVILLDTINGWLDNYAVGRNAVLKMLDRIPADERIALYVLVKYQGLVILQDYTSDRAVLKDKLKQYIPQWMCPTPFRGPSPCATEVFMRMGFETVLESFKALAKGLGSQPGRKSVFWVTQGFTPDLLRHEPTWNDTLAALNDANVAISTVDTNGLIGPRRIFGADAPLAMREIADRTGGIAYDRRNDLDTALTEGIEQSRAGYTLGFYLSDLDGKYHTLKVKVNRPGVQLDYRQGYYALDDAKEQKLHHNADISAMLLSSADTGPIGITARFDRLLDAPGTLNLHLNLTPAEVLSLKAGGRGATGRTGHVKELVLALNAAGRIVREQTGTSQFTVGPDNQALFDQHGVTIVQAVQVPPDAVKLSIVIQDVDSGRTGSLSVPLR